MIDRYRNEIIVAVSILLLIIAILYKHHSEKLLKETIKEVRTSIYEIEESKRLKSLWYAKGMKSKLNRLKSRVESNKISKFNIERKKVRIKLKNLNSRDLNRFMNDLVKLPLQISSLDISKSNKNYSLECLCKW